MYDAQGSVAAEVARFLAWVRSSPPMQPGAAVLLPGDIERKTRAERMAQGIPIDAATRTDLLAAAASVGIAPGEADALTA